MHTRATSAKAKLGSKSKTTPSVSRSRKTADAMVDKTEKPPVRVFVSYSHRDAEARAKLETHLAPLKRDGVETWFDGDMNAGDKLDTEIARALRNAHIFVALLSPEYLASHYCWKIEYRRAMNRRASGTMRVVAVVVRPCDWKASKAAGFKLLPEDGRDVTRWRSADDAYLNVAQGLRRVVAAVRKDLASAVKRRTPRKTAASTTDETAPKPPAKRAPARRPAKPPVDKPVARPVARKKRKART